MNTTRLVEVPQYNFSGIEGYEGWDVPLYAVANGKPGEQGYHYAEVYKDGTLRLRGCVMTEEPFTFITINPNNGRLITDDFLAEDPLRIMPHLYELLRSAGVPEAALTPVVPSERSLAQGDPYAGSTRDSAHRLTGIALRALQFSRWRNYDLFDDPTYKPDPRMGRDEYAQAIGTVVERFGSLVVAREVTALIDVHFASLHTDLHTPGFVRRSHSDGSPQGEDYMTTARQVIRGTHGLARTMRHAGLRVNFLSIFGDADFWSATRQAHPDIFNAAVDHILGLPDPYEQQVYGEDALISPVGLVQSHFAKAHEEIVVARPDFKSDTSPNEAITMRDYSLLMTTR